MRSKLLLMGLLIVITNYLSAQVLSGKVTNALNEPVVGASIKVLAEANRGTTTNIEGRYNMALPGSRTYEIEITAIGYVPKIISEIIANNGAYSELNITLETKAAEMEGVVVTAKRTSARLETAASVIQFQKNTNTVASVLSAETISRSPDRSTGEVLKRVSGASMQEGKYIIVRGLSDRYNTALLNGVQLSSTEPDRKAFAFDMFPAAMVDNIIINKTFVPENPGEWAGGLIQVNTKDIPNKNFFNLQLGTGFNTNSLGKKFYTYKGGKLDWLGIDDGTRALPDNMPTKTNFSALSDAEKIGYAKEFATNWSVQEGSIPANASLQASGGFNTFLFNKKFGGIVALTYSNSAKITPFENRFFNINGTQADINFDYKSKKYSRDVLAGVLANFSIMLNNNNKISLKNMLNSNSSKYVTLRTGIDYEADPVNGENIRARELAFKNNTFFNTILKGEHSINVGNEKSTLNWYGSFGILDQYVPQQKRLQYNQASDAGAPYLALISRALSQKTGSVFYSNLSDYLYNVGGDYTLPFRMFDKKQTVKGGYLFQVKDRLYDARPFSIFLQTDNPTLRALDEDHIFVADNFAEDKFNFDELEGSQYRYMANSILNAGYIQFDNQFSSVVRAIWGVRYENFDQLVGSTKQSDPRHVRSQQGDWLPALNLMFKINPKTNIRLSGSQTVARPEFRELSPMAFYDFELGATILGNKDLQRTKISNIDLRYELYPRSGELFTVGAFYKYFNNPIELYFNQSGVGTSNTFNYLNVDKAYGFGGEIEFRKKLDFTDALRNFTFQSNIAYIFSKVTDPNVKVNRPMQGQSPYLINALLQYDLEKYGINATVLFNQIGRRILYVGNDQVPEIWEAPRALVDFQIAKKFAGDKGQIKLNISDIFNQWANYYHDLNSDAKYNNGIDATAIRRLYGTGIGLSVGYNF
ncbi:MAG: outer membrane beta-barrel protein [Niabella sp.]